jgi:ABC-type transport system involved in multi-copper enzyme maturation permease subunit
MWIKTLTVMMKFALREVLRKKVLVAGGLLTGVFLFVFVLGLHFINEQIHGKGFEQIAGFQFFTLGLYAATFLIVVIAAFAGVSAVSGEIETGTAYGLLASPVPRSQILLGKFLGYAFLLVVYDTVVLLAIWGATAWQLGVAIPGVIEILPLLYLETLTMLALSFLGSVLFSSLTNGITIFLLYGVALLGGMVEQIGALARGFSTTTVTALINAGIITSLILPVDALYRRSIYLVSSKAGGITDILHNLGPFGSLSAPSVWMEVYAVIYLCACLAAATYLFSRKDI